MRQLKLASRPPELGSLVIRYPLLFRVVPLCLFAFGLLGLSTDLGRVKGECCSPSYWNHDPAIEFSSLWVTLVGFLLISAYRKVTFAGSVVKVSWLGGVLQHSVPVQQVYVSESVLEDRSGEKAAALTLQVGWIPVTISSELGGYEQLRLMIEKREDP